MTDANKESWKWEGQKDERRMEDLLAVRVLDDAAGFATEETLEDTALEIFLFPILGKVTLYFSDDVLPLERISRRG